MNYQINLTGIHCSGCVNLIKMSLEDVGLEEVVIDQISNTANFKNGENDIEVNTLLQTAFKDLEDYKFSNLHILN